MTKEKETIDGTSDRRAILLHSSFTRRPRDCSAYQSSRKGNGAMVRQIRFPCLQAE